MKHRTTRIHVFNVLFQLPFCENCENLDSESLNSTISNYLTGIIGYSQELLNDLQDFELANLYDLTDLALVPTQKDTALITEKIVGVFDNISQIDLDIISKLKGWEIARIAKVDLALLRLAIYEMNFAKNNTSTASIINAAVDLAKIYGTDDSQQFINGVLGKLAKQ
ncbi:MAG: transcription antitermination factor NusB [Firmicutes bacterium]|nr:transcription antitermination factor NusB [Bacillota bacterium]